MKTSGSGKIVSVEGIRLPKPKNLTCKGNILYISCNVNKKINRKLLNINILSYTKKKKFKKLFF